MEYQSAMLTGNFGDKPPILGYFEYGRHEKNTKSQK